MKARILSAAVGASALLAACATPRTAPPAEPVGAPPTYSALGVEGVMGANARALIAEFGPADLDAREGPGRKLQFLGPVCVLDAYLYAPRAGAEPVVTYIDARLPDGRDMDRASCVAALSLPSQAH